MIEIIPAIDLIEGNCVRLTQGDYSQKKVYSANPLQIAQKFEEAGIRRLHMVDLEGARSGALKNLAVLEKLARETELAIDYSGGLRTADDIENVFSAGASQVLIGSLAVKDPPFVKELLKKYGAEKIIIGADTKEGKIMISGWQQSANQDIQQFLADYAAEGAKWILCTEISVDGMLAGPAYGLYSKMVELFPDIKLIASGGVADIEQVHRLNQIGLQGVVIGKALYEGKIELSEFKPFLEN